MSSPAPISQTEPATRDLSAAVAACFSPDTTTPAFPDRLVELATALINQRNTAIWALTGEEGTPEVIAQNHQALTGETEREIARETLAEGEASQTALIRVSGPYLTATVALPGNGLGALIMAMPEGGAVPRSLAYERLTLLSNLSFAQFRHGDLTAQSQMTRTITAIAKGDDTQTQNLADSLARLMGAEYVAVSRYKAGDVGPVAISGQSGMTKRAQLPAKLRNTMREIATKTVRTADRFFAAAPGLSDGLAIIVERPTRNTGMLQLAGAVFGQAQQTRQSTRWTRARLAKIAAGLLVVAGIGLIPLRDGVDIPASVEAAEKRIITAPLSAPISEVLVTDKQQVIADETELVRLDTREIDIEIIGAVAERANAVLERETARASRNAALLRNAELEVERLDARIALLELQQASSIIRAPISGIALLGTLEQRTGATVRQGEVLLEVSDPDALRLSLSIVESQAGKVGEGETGLFRPDFDPSLRLSAQISTISPALDNSEEIPVILGKAEFEETAETLRPGLRGVFAVGQQRRPIAEILYRNIRNWLLLRVWL